MKGKIFPESSNVYQDEAKILFDYYQQAAERIVQEEQRIEKEIKVLEENRLQLEQERSSVKTWLLLFCFIIPFFIKRNNLQKQIDAINVKIAEFKKQHKAIFRDYKVTKLGVAYVPVAEQIKYEDKSFIVDYTGKVGDTEITLQMPRRNDLLIETISKLENLSAEAPIIESSEDVETIDTEDYSTSIQKLNQNDYIGGLERSLKTISYCMDDIDSSSVSLPLVADASDYLSDLNSYSTAEVPEQALVVEVFDKSRYARGVEQFQELNKLKDSLSTKTQQFEDVLTSLMMTMANSVQTITTLKVASVDKVVFESNKILFNILKSPYNHYSPYLEYEEIERIRNEKFDYSEDAQDYEPFNLKQSSRVRFNLVTGLWTSEDGNTTNMPFGVHQIYEEIVSPMVQNLMMENRIERLKIYNHIKDQKISYLNKWHQDTDAFYRANRAESADIINLMQESLRKYVAAYNTLVSLQRTEDSMVQSNGSLDSAIVEVVDNAAETLAAFELQSQEFQNTQSSFEEYIERLKDDIDQKAEKFGYIEYYDAKLRDGYSNEVAVASGEIHNLDERRKGLATVNPLFAKSSELPPQPSVEDITFEHITLNLPNIAKNALSNLAEDFDEEEFDENNESEEFEDLEEQDELNEREDLDEKEKDVDEEVNDVDDDEEDKDEEDDDNAEDDEKEFDIDDNEEIFTREQLEAMDDDDIKAVMFSLAIKYNDKEYDREQAINVILEKQS